MTLGLSGQGAVSVKGKLDASKLRDAIREVVGRHEILRTVFHRHTGVKVPFQVILEFLSSYGGLST